MMPDFTLILLSSFIFGFSTGLVDSSCVYKAVGERVELKLTDVAINKDHDLTWTFDKTKVYEKRKGIVKKNKGNSEGFSIDLFGAMILENIQTNRSGIYAGEIFHRNGKLQNKKEYKLCVEEPLSKPTVQVECRLNVVILTCKVAENTQMDVSWERNGQPWVRTDTFLQLNSSELRSGDSFSCVVRNNVSESKAVDVRPSCSDSGGPATKTNPDTTETNVDSSNEDPSGKPFLFGLDFWWTLVILTGAASFLVLFIIFIVCVCHCQRRKRRKAKEEVEYRLANLIPDVSDPPDEQQYLQKTEPQRPSKSQRPLPPLPSHRAPPC